MPIVTPALLQEAADHLAAHDDVLAPIIAESGLAHIQPHTNYYWELVDSIISQQLSVKAAATIERRFQALFDNEYPEPLQILNKSIDDLRSVGLSRAKATYIRDLARHVVDGRVQFDMLDVLSNDGIIATLTDIKGVGEWTVHMFLIFCMGRLDVLPVGDLGIRNGIRTLYGFDELPKAEQIRALALRNQWHPYESVASWYVWRSLDNTPKP